VQRLAASFAAATIVLSWGAPTTASLRDYYGERRGADWRTVASMLERLVPPGDRVVATLGAVYPLRYYWSERVQELAETDLPGPPKAGRGLWVIDGGWDRPAELTTWLATHAVKVEEVPPSWSLPGVGIYRVRATAR